MQERQVGREENSYVDRRGICAKLFSYKAQDYMEGLNGKEEKEWDVTCYMEKLKKHAEDLM